MLGKSVALCSPHRADARRMRACLCAAGNEVTLVSQAGPAMELVLAGAVDLLVVDCTDWIETRALVGAARGRVPVVAIVEGADSQLMVDLMCDHGVQHLVSRRPQVDPTELVVTVEKILRSDPFGLAKYLTAFGVELLEREIAGADDRDESVEAIQHAARELGASRSLCGSIGTIADELITNAVYNAPRDAAGNPLYLSRDRRDKIELAPHERPRLVYGSDGVTFGIGVCDPFGALTGDDLRQALRRCLTSADQIEHKAGGAGLGLYMIARSCRQLVINVEPQQRTEVIALIDLHRPVESHSLHVFVAPQLSDGVPEEAVTLSDTLKLDLRSVAGGNPRAIPLVKPKSGRSVRAITAEEPRLTFGDLLPPMEAGTGLGTASAAIRGALDADGVLETALRFFGARFGGAVLFDVNKGGVRARCASGEIFAWSELLDTRVRHDTRCTLAQLARGPGIYRGPLARHPEDEPLIERLTGDVAATGAILTLAIRGEVRHLLCGFDPLPDELCTPADLDALAQEITRRLDRLGKPHRERCDTARELFPNRIAAGEISA